MSPMPRLSPRSTASPPGLFPPITQVKAVQVARAAAAASSPSRLGPSPPSPCSASASTVPGAPKFFSRPTGNAAGTSHTGNGAFGGGTRGGDDKSAAATPTDALPSELVVDVVVVGSGAGGGCVAGTLAATGLKVVVLEKGGLYDATDFGRFSEMEAYQKLYEGQVRERQGSISYRFAYLVC